MGGPGEAVIVLYGEDDITEWRVKRGWEKDVFKGARP